jgi:hypothetical protein
MTTNTGAARPLDRITRITPIICAIEADRGGLDLAPDPPVLRFAAYWLLPALFGALAACILWQVLACGSDVCIPVSSVRAPCLTFRTPGWPGCGMAGYSGLLATGQVWTGSPVSAYWR